MATSVFLSYSRKDEAAARQLESDLEGGRVAVWRDAELRGGDLWWQKILEQIRACDVFVLALSNNGLTSKPCRAELAYARDLDLPVLPVQIGPVDSLRTAAVGELQVIEYRQQSGASGIALFAELEEAGRRRHPLPDPLPPAPSVPFAYLLRLGSEIEKEQLTPTEQGDLVGQLQNCLETEDDEGVKDDARELLRALRRRPDVTFRHAGEIDQLLSGSTAHRSAEQPTPTGSGTSGARQSTAPGAGAGVTAASTSASAPTGYGAPGGYRPPPFAHGPPPPGGPGYPPAAGAGLYGAPGPPTTTKGSRLPLLLVAALVVVAALIVGGVLAFGGDPGPGPTPTTNAEPTTDALPTTSAEPPPTTGTTAGEQLLAILPGDVDPGSCSAQALAGDGDLAALGCGPALTQPGPLTTQFNLYPAGGVDGVFQGDVEAVALAEFGPGQQCPDYLGYGGYNQNGQVRGRVACGVGQGNASYLLWTDDEFAAEALVTIPNGGGQGIYTLWNWFVDPGRSAFGP